MDTGAAYKLGALNVTGATNLHTTDLSDVAVISSTGADILRVYNNGNIEIHGANMTLSASSGLLLSSNTYGPCFWFRDNMDVSFFGNNMVCSVATLTAKKLISLNGLTATYGTNVLDVNATNTTITGPMILNGNIS